MPINLGMDIRQTNCPERRKGTFGGGGFKGVKHSKVRESSQTAGPIGTNCGSRRRIHLGMGIYIQVDPQYRRGHGGGGGVRGS